MLSWLKRKDDTAEAYSERDQDTSSADGTTAPVHSRRKRPVIEANEDDESGPSEEKRARPSPREEIAVQSIGAHCLVIGRMSSNKGISSTKMFGEKRVQRGKISVEGKVKEGRSHVG